MKHLPTHEEVEMPFCGVDFCLYHDEELRTLMSDLKYGPKHLVLLLAFVTGILGVFHLVAEFQQSVFDVLEAIRWRFAVFGGPDSGHLVELMSGCCDRFGSFLFLVFVE